MFKEYIYEVKTSGIKGVILLTKASLKYQALLYLIQFAVIILIVLAFFGSFAMDIFKMQGNPNAFVENQAAMMNIFQRSASKILLVIPIYFLLIAWSYTAALSINDQIIKGNRANFGEALKQSFSGLTLRMMGLILLLFAFILMAVLVFGGISVALVTVSKPIGILIGFIFFIVFGLLMFRVLAAPAYIVHGNQSPFDAIKSSFQSITWVRSLILLVIAVAIYIGFFLIMLLFGSITPNMGSGITNLIISQAIMLVFAVILISVFYAAMSSLYYRYTDNTASESIDEHLVTDI